MCRRFFVFLFVWLLVSCSYSPTVPKVVSNQPPAVANQVIQTPSIRLASFNIAHGRKDTVSQVFLGEKKIRKHLVEISQYLKGLNADIVALQEADGPSAWSGNFDHVAFLAEKSGFSYYVRSEHVQNWWGDYGTGLLSRHAFKSVYGHTFKPSPPTTRKGFTLATVFWQAVPQLPPMNLDIVSLHLDFAQESTRRKQIQELVNVLTSRHNPVIMMGDFNSEMIATSFLPNSFKQSRLKFSAKAEHSSSFGDRNLDWIIVSDELKFIDYYVDQVILSDHRPVVAEIALATQ